MPSIHFVRNVSSFAALACVISDFAVAWRQEYRHIWKSSQATSAKCIYLFSRYWGIGSQIINCVMLMGPLSLEAIRPGVCRGWFIFHTMVFLTLLSALECLLALRIYALYLQDRKISFILISILFAALVINIVCGIRIPILLSYDFQCTGLHPPKDLMLSGGTILGKHALLWGLMMYRHHTACKDGWSHVVILRRTMRDAWGIFAALTAIIVGTQPYMYVKGTISLHIVLWWPTILVSIFTCRLILSFSSLRTEEPADTYSVELDTGFDSTDSILDIEPLAYNAAYNSPTTTP